MCSYLDLGNTAAEIISDWSEKDWIWIKVAGNRFLTVWHHSIVYTQPNHFYSILLLFPHFHPILLVFSLISKQPLRNHSHDERCTTVDIQFGFGFVLVFVACAMLRISMIWMSWITRHLVCGCVFAVICWWLRRAPAWECQPHYLSYVPLDFFDVA